MKKMIQTLVCALGTLGLISCSQIDNQDIGMATGGVAGGLLGSQFGGGTGKLLAVGAGALTGALIGGAVGKNMDKNDQLRTQQAIEQAPTGQATRWQNPDSGNQYSITPTQTYQRHGVPCREYTMTANINGKPEKVYGKACRQADGSWQHIQ